MEVESNLELSRNEVDKNQTLEHEGEISDRVKSSYQLLRSLDRGKMIKSITHYGQEGLYKLRL